MSYDFADRLLRRGQEGYERARAAAVWRANKPPRFPEAIVLAQDAQDVIAAVRLARQEKLKVGVRSGGHSWVSPHMRDGSVLIDVSRLSAWEIDPDTRTAWVGPGLKGRKLNDALAPFGLMAPTGHHDSVGCGGFLLCGGFGWNFRQWGNGCANVTAIELVTPDGELICADDNQNQDYFWAARGGGPGFFGAVTRFQMKTYPRPPFLRSNGYVFPLEAAEDAVNWLLEVAEKAPPYMELVATGAAADAEGRQVAPRLSISGLVFAQTEAEAAAAKALFDSCPLKEQAITRRDNVPTTLEERYASATAVDPEGFRYAVDNAYTDASGSAIAPLVRGLLETMPTYRTHIFVLHQGPRPDLSGMALSAWGKTYVAAYPIWEDPAQDEAMEQWVIDGMRSFEPVANGEGQMNDENMRARSARYLSPEAESRLERLRAKHDPDHLFVSFLR